MRWEKSLVVPERTVWNHVSSASAEEQNCEKNQIWHGGKKTAKSDLCGPLLIPEMESCPSVFTGTHWMCPICYEHSIPTPPAQVQLPCATPNPKRNYFHWLGCQQSGPLDGKQAVTQVCLSLTVCQTIRLSFILSVCVVSSQNLSHITFNTFAATPVQLGPRWTGSLSLAVSICLLRDLSELSEQRKQIFPLSTCCWGFSSSDYLNLGVGQAARE